MASLSSLLMPGSSETLHRHGHFSKHDFFLSAGVAERPLRHFTLGLIRRLAEGFYHISSGVEEIFCFRALELMCSLTSSFLLVFQTKLFRRVVTDVWPFTFFCASKIFSNLLWGCDRSHLINTMVQLISQFAVKTCLFYNYHSSQALHYAGL